MTKYHRTLCFSQAGIGYQQWHSGAEQAQLPTISNRPLNSGRSQCERVWTILQIIR